MAFIDNFLNKETFSVISHRGGAGEAPENTLSAIKKSLSSKVDIIEVDVQQTKDGKDVLFHDESAERIMNIHEPIQKFTYRELLNAVRSQEYLPTIEDVLSEINGKTGLYLDIKQPNIIDSLTEIIKMEGAEDWVAIVGKDPLSLIHAKNWIPKITTGLSFDKPYNGELLANKTFDIIMPKYNLLTETTAKRLEDLKCKISVWTINSISDALDMYKLGVDGITTDYPSLLMKLRELILMEKEFSNKPLPFPKYAVHASNIP
ncbi:MAG: glycerophosphodiester phosphodiesterase [Candidatus Njordarchaeia archaeon]